MQLKNDGNRLHGDKRYSEAAEKYERARTNLAAHTSTEAATIMKACRLNLASCYLNLQQLEPCVTMCNEILAGVRPLLLARSRTKDRIQLQRLLPNNAARQCPPGCTWFI